VGGGRGGEEEGGGKGIKMYLSEVFFTLSDVGKQSSIYSFPHTCLANLNNTVNINHQPAYNTVML
jgi:hypothetical protein